MASSSVASSLAAALGAPPSDKLSRENHLLWKGQVLSALRGAQVMELLDGSDHAPAKTKEVSKTLIDGGAGLSVISVETFEKLQVPYERLMPTRPFSGVTDGLTTPLG